ncbi:MAG: PD-(D/E)XK nuclease family protein [archaeon]
MIDFDKLIDKYLEREFRPKQIGRYYPSEIGGCLRKTWYSYKFPKEIDTKLARVFEAGNILHEFIADVIKSDKNKDVELLRSEMPIQIKTKDFVISGRIDNLVLLKVCDANGNVNEKDCKEVLVEVKSTKFLPEECKKEHEMQLQIYMRATGVENGVVLYVQKDNLEMKWFDVKLNVVEGEKIIERFERIHESLVSGKMPIAEAKMSSESKWMCDYCPWKAECDKSGSL